MNKLYFLPLLIVEQLNILILANACKTIAVIILGIYKYLWYKVYYNVLSLKQVSSRFERKPTFGCKLMNRLVEMYKNT